MSRKGSCCLQISHLSYQVTQIHLCFAEPRKPSHNQANVFWLFAQIIERNQVSKLRGPRACSWLANSTPTVSSLSRRHPRLQLSPITDSFTLGAGSHQNATQNSQVTETIKITLRQEVTLPREWPVGLLSKIKPHTS